MMDRDLRQHHNRLADGGVCAIFAAGAAVIGAAGTAYAANKSSKATKAAAASATKAADTNNALQRDIYNQNKSVLDPYISQGVNNTNKINALLASNPYEMRDFKADPGYQFRLDQGLGAVTQSRAVGGLLKSGSALKALNDYAQGSASQEYAAANSRHQQTTGNYLNALGNQQAAGVAAGSALAGVGTNYANSISANNNNAASVSGNAALAGANQTNNLIGQGINALSYGVGAYGQQRGSSYGTNALQHEAMFR